MRVPVYNAHSESVNVQTREELSPERCRELLDAAPGVTVVDDPAAGALSDADRRCRAATTCSSAGSGATRRTSACLNMWVVSDNLRKGAATNAVQLAEQLHARGGIRAHATA